MSTQDRRSFLAAASSLALGLALPATAGAATVNGDFGTKVIGATLSVVNAVAGGSAKEFAAMQAAGELAPGAALAGFDLSLYEAVKYAAVKAPATKDPRAGLRLSIPSKVADNLYKVAVDSGINPKVYDARGDGLSNAGKGGVVKGMKGLLDGLAKKGLLDDATVDAAGYDEAKWQQANPATLKVSIKNPAGAAARTQLEADQVGLDCDVISSIIVGYLKACKVVAVPEKAVTAEGVTITLKVSWAGRSRQKATMERRANDKLNAARQFTKEDKE